MEAVKSEPPRPSVVGMPSVVEPMNPPITGTRDCASRGVTASRTRWLVSSHKGVACV